jgi:hypothetical protein
LTCFGEQSWWSGPTIAIPPTPSRPLSPEGSAVGAHRRAHERLEIASRVLGCLAAMASHGHVDVCKPADSKKAE